MNDSFVVEDHLFQSKDCVNHLNIESVPLAVLFHSLINVFGKANLKKLLIVVRQLSKVQKTVFTGSLQMLF
jgi:hypothetical protein